jgi:predicted transcriptional regulator
VTRILADLPDEEIERLDRIAREQGKSRASVLREAVASYQAQPASVGKAWLDIGFGAWRDRSDIGDAVDWQRRERASATRPWDDDYEDVKDEFPDLFNAEDDRQRQIHLDMLAGKYPDPRKPKAK